MTIPTGPQFDVIASTGRTATTYFATALNSIAGVAACHEGYQGSEHETSIPLLPLINLENAQLFAKPEKAAGVVADKRNADVIAQAQAQSGAARVIDVAYYNPTIAQALLQAWPNMRLVGIIRNCEAFVRSATTLTGEDPLPVGWPDPNKSLTAREKFIAMGRIRPVRGSDMAQAWNTMGAIARNIWLWRETNQLLCAAKEAFPDRVSLIRFETFQTDPTQVWDQIGRVLDLHDLPDQPEKQAKGAVNKKPFGYQIGQADTWQAPDLQALNAAQAYIDERAIYEC